MGYAGKVNVTKMSVGVLFRRFFLVVLTAAVLGGGAACSLAASPGLKAPPAIPSPPSNAATPRPAGTAVVSASPPATPSGEAVAPPAGSSLAVTHTEPLLCFTVEVPGDWKIDGKNGGFASFVAPGKDPSFIVSNVSLKNATLSEALMNLRNGALGSNIQELQDITISGEPGYWVTFMPGVEFTFVALVVRPECERGPGTLFFAAREADKDQFESFLGRVRLVK